MRNRRYLLLTITVCLFISSYGQHLRYQDFETIPESDLLKVNCFVQDPLGMVWIGTDKGVFNYDGYTLNKQASPDFPRSRNSIHCGIVFDEEHIWFGSGRGLLVYNYRTDEYEVPPADIPFDIRTMLLCGDTLWIGSIHGLYRYHIAGRMLEKTDVPEIPHQTVFSIIRSNDDILYIGTYNGLCCYNPSTGLFQKIGLPPVSGKSNLFVNSLYYDAARHCIWVGTEGALFRYDPVTGTTGRISRMDGNTIKAIASDPDGNLLLGTDNGLYVYDDSGMYQHIVHDSRYVQSLVNSIVWTIFTDRNRNVWLGTGGGISLYQDNRLYLFVPISRLTGIGDGNSFSKIFKDSRNNFWFGGTSGLISVPDIRYGTGTWYRMGDAFFPVPHNQIRDIYEDRDQNLWIATDGSISRFDDKRNQFVRYTIVDSTQQFNSNWAYSLLEDDHGRLWIATWLGGIFVVDKASLMRSPDGKYVAEQHLTKKNGLTDHNVRKLVRDRCGNIWAVCKGIFKIQPETCMMERITLRNNDQEELIPLHDLILCDQDGFIWVVVPDGICRIDPDTNKITYTRIENFEGCDIFSMVEAGQHIWISFSDGMLILNRETPEVRCFDMVNKNFAGGIFEPSTNSLYFGTIDGIVIFPERMMTGTTDTSAILLTALYVNDKLFNPGHQSIRYTRSVNLKHDRNNVVFEFSDLLYTHRSKKLIYRLLGADHSWRILKPGSNRISYTSLPPGRYELEICYAGMEGNPSGKKSSFSLVIDPPWYYSPWAKGVYVVWLCVLILLIVNYFRIKNRLRIERIEKKKSLELSRLKIDFFTDISHEFKTPLSLILAPVSKLIHESKNPESESDLKLIEQNALHLNTLIHHALNFQRVDENEPNLILSMVEMAGFVRKIFDSYQTIFSGKQINASFISNFQQLYMNIDILKIESVLNNLLSNACKFTGQDGTIELMLSYRDTGKILEIVVSDSGSGIPENEMPYIFDRFFQSRLSREKGGTGIGLYLVKNYTELHGGSVAVQSRENKGTAFTVSLPETVAGKGEHEPVPAGVAGENIGRDTPLILVVDDNMQVTEFIARLLGKYYRVVTASDGKSGLDVCMKSIPDLIIADVMMPGMDGLEMCRQIRKHALCTITPIILLTARNDMDTERKSVDIGVECFIAKPFDAYLLLSRVRQMIRKQKQLEEKIRMEALSAPGEIEAVSESEQFLSKVTQIIEDRISEPDLNVNTLSVYANVSTKQLYRKIKHLTGQSPVEYIKSIRVKKAAMLLSRKNFSVAEVMYLVGFSSHSYFSKCFQEEFGKTPRQYMESTDQ